MNKTFSRIINGGKNAIKYIVFSFTFVFAFILGAKGVGAANTDFPYSNDKIEQGNNVCSATGLANGYLSYVIQSSNYKGSATNCVAYSYPASSPTTKYFYLQGEDDNILVPDKAKLQTIQFKITGTVGNYTHVAVFEDTQTLGKTPSYDLYTMTGANTYTYELVKEIDNDDVDNDTYYDSNKTNINKGYFKPTTLEFSYALRTPVYGLNSVYVYFYNGVPDQANPSVRTEISFYLAKPIVDFTSESVEVDTRSSVADSPTGCHLGVDGQGKICLVYKNGTQTVGTHDIYILFPKNVAFYYSTINNHTSVTDKTVDNIAKYNSIYADNTFNNLDSSPVVYRYYNFTDSTTYTGDTNNKINVKDDAVSYKMYLTMDATGTYKFTITDIFGTFNTTTASITVTDTANRDLDIWFLKSLNSASGTDVVLGDTTEATFFNIDATGSNLTKNNVQIVLETYYTVQIDPNNATNVSGTINSNPLQANGAGGVKESATWYCKNHVSDVSGRSPGSATGGDCYTATSKYLTHTFDSSQSVAATYAALDTGKDANNYSIGSLVNSFAFDQGTLNTTNAKAVTGQKNKTFVWVNENGMYRFYVEDDYTNKTTAWIDVSIIDQLQPTLSFDSTITNPTNESNRSTTLCTSTYVAGGNKNFAAPIFEKGGAGSYECANQSVTYDVTSDFDSTDVTDTGRVETSRYKLDSIGTDGAKLIYYNKDDGRSFNYADAIRIARLTAIDSVTSLSAKNATSLTTSDATPSGLSSVYYPSNATFTAYTLSTRSIKNNATIIGGNYVQYASELTTFTGIHDSNQIRIYIEVNGARIDFGSGDNVCNSAANATTCYSYVNNYIDRGIDFKMIFTAIDFTGNISNEYTIAIDVKDDTSAGIIDVDPTTGAITTARPDIQLINIDTLCRIEVGNTVQLKKHILGCYGFADLNADRTAITGYNFADNKSGITDSSGSPAYINYNHTNFGNVLSQQWYQYKNAFDVNIEVQVEVTSGNWTTVSDSSRNITLKDAGYYKIKFIITDNKLSSGSSTDPLTNTTTLICWYYVNPKVLLIAPHAQTHEYGTTTQTLSYDVYITTSDEAFHTNIYSVDSDKLPLYLKDYVKVNASDRADNSFLTLEDRAMAGELKAIDVGAHDTAGAGIWTTADSKINTANTVNAGAYYITLGDLYVKNTSSNAADSQNYIIRLHPAYLINGKNPDGTLDNYSQASVQENVSNVHLIIQQKILYVTANGGTKIYGVLDTNHKYADTIDAVTNSNSTIGYLGGYTVTGFAVNNTQGINDSVSVTYDSNSIIKGVLRRQSGEKVGSYAICNFKVRVSGTISSPKDYINDANCGSSDTAKWGTQGVTVVTITTNNVYYLDKADSSYKAVTGLTATDISNGSVAGIGYYVKDGSGNYFKITYENIDPDDKSKLAVDTETWKITYNSTVYDDSEDALQVTANTINENKNYVISYTGAEYTITRRNLVIQPGIHQGKEYSSPEHKDPIWQIVIYGEMEANITKSNGYTVDIGLSYQSRTPTTSDYQYQGSAETAIYFARRKKTAEANNTYLYTYKTPITSSKFFTLDGVEYEIKSTTSICRKDDTAGKECYAATDGVFTIGFINKVKIDGSNAVVTITGNLEYQNYTLFRSSATGSAGGTGYITRQAGETVAWYAFKNDLTNLLPVAHGKSASDGANYTTSYNDNAPAVTTSGSGASKQYTHLTSEGSATNEYIPDGDNACATAGSAYYSVPCTSGNIVPNTATSKQILFEIFRRDIILSFNYVDDYYGYAYLDYKTWYLDFTSTNNSTPKNAKDGSDIITCYQRASEGGTGTKYVVNSVEYVKATSCSDSDQGLALSDSWGSSGLKLVFKLTLEDNTLFHKASGSVYALPAGMHYVHASIDNDNYRLVYVDYYAAKGSDGSDTSNNGVIDVKSSQVTLNGTSYQKEYGEAIYDKYNNQAYTGDWTNASANIFDLNYVGLATIANGSANVGGGYSLGTTGSETGVASALKDSGSLHERTAYNSLANVYGYTVSPNAIGASGDAVSKDTSFKFAGGATVKSGSGLTVITDTIYNNFYGIPVRARDNYASFNADDKYGLLDGVGRYLISLDNITATFAKYSTDDAAILGAAAPNVGSSAVVSTTVTNTNMIVRYTNYSITAKNKGTLFILPASIEIEVVDGQTKMYGCAYNGPTSGTPTWSRTTGYSNCDEGIADYYDFGYTYDVYGDKTFELLDNSSAKLKGYNLFSEANTLAAYETGSVVDLVYNNDASTPVKSYQVKGIVSAHAGGTDKNNISYTVVGQASATVINNSALNNGVLYRAVTTTPTSAKEYSYSDYWTFAKQAQTKADGKYVGFQDQSVASYVLTLGNLDASFNKNSHCSNISQPTGDGSYNCKNFIVYKDDNNTSTHTKTGTTESVSDASLKHSYKGEFAITEREVKLHTEYNYKVVGDTDSLEGFTCAQIAAMYTRTSGYNAGATFSFTGRTDSKFVCDAADSDFINMGSARYYAVDNSLAKAPWTKWSDSRQDTSATAGSAYYLYDDILWDVIEGLLGRKNEGNTTHAEYNANGINDKVGTYVYDWSNIKVRTDNDSGDGYDDDYTLEVLMDGTKDQGFFTTVSSVTQRWYLDDRHNQVNKETKDGYDYYSFNIKKTATAAAGTTEFTGNYPFSTIDKDYGHVYYEIVKREIILVADDVEKVYGIEDAYALFTVKLCSSYDASTGACSLASKDEAYGNRYALSKDDYTYFINNDGTYNQERIKGYTDTTGYNRFVGTNTVNTSYTVRGSFGIYYYRAIGEEVGEYVIKACPTQLASGNPTCDSTSPKLYEAGSDGTNYNAANYKITSYAGKLTIKVRSLDITPDAGQGFQYGNYVAGTKIAPITYKEYYTGVALNNGANGYQTNTQKGGLVNGAIGVTKAGAAISDDSLNKQYSLCLFDISGYHKVCINDRQNKTLSNNASGANEAYTGQYTTSTTIKMPGESGGNTVANADIKWVNNNVYNDDYTEDNDTSRMALDRVIGASTDSQRYNRNVGVYTIVPGDLSVASHAVCANDSAKNCLNTNYDIKSVTADVTYEITEADLTVTVTDSQSKIYGQRDVELKFSVATTFTTDELPVDYYYCGASQDACKQTFNSTATAGNTSVTITGFAYEENGSDADHNYGKSKASNKAASSEQKVSQTTIAGLRYFDKYCLTGAENAYGTTFTEFACAGTYDGYNTTNVALTYTADTSRILLGYLYVAGWAQTAGDHAIYNGMVVALNEHGNENYILNYDTDTNKDTGETFTIDKLELAVSIENITKTYGEATDGFKCENGSCSIRTTGASKLLKALNTENRLEFNFNVVNYGNSTASGLEKTGVEDEDTSDPQSVIYLTHKINGKYYTHTAAAETKNVHLGLTVIRAYEAATTSNKCSVGNDLFGCEDATDANGYKLRFLHSDVTDSVDSNYLVHIGSTAIELEATDNNYVAITRGATKDTKTTFAATDKYVKNSEIAKLVINKRDITFYIGTYNSAELVDERFTIEQEEMLPSTPLIKDPNKGASPGYLGGMAYTNPSNASDPKNTNPAEREVYYVTWFDNVDPDAVYARQVRTADTITSWVSTKTGHDSDNAYGIAYCRTNIKDMSDIESVNDVNVTNCGDANVVYPSRANVQEDGDYVFSTKKTGTYAMIRDKNYTGVSSNTTYINSYTNTLYEAKNYTTTDVNGTLVIYEDKTAPTIQVPTDMQYAIEANAHVTCTTGASPVCTIEGKQVGANADQWSLDQLGNVIKYLTEHYSNFTLKGSTIKETLESGETLSALKTNNLVIRNGLVNTVASENETAFGAYCKRVDDTGCTELFITVNNPGLKYTEGQKSYTTYPYLRTEKDYDFDGSYIDDPIKAVTSIISWFNITSYDYGYIREGNYTEKRYNPRYYIFINGSTDSELNHFDPRYVGDFTISIYAVDNIGNVSDPATVTLRIKDTTKPVVGDLYLFNTQVVCSASDKECASDISKWTVKTSDAGVLVHINSFVKYKYDGTNYTVDDANGTFIKIGNSYVSLYGSRPRFTAAGVQDVNGMYIKLVTADVVSALEVEHRYWNNANIVYAVVIGGTDNSFIHDTPASGGTTTNAIDVEEAQWETYYKINTSWYKYTRKAKEGVAITTSEGVNEVVIAAIDSGRTITSTSQSHFYYDAIFLMDKSATKPGDAIETEDEMSVIRDIPTITANNTFIVLGTTFKLDRANAKVTWGTNDNKSATITDNKFTAGIVTCTFTDDTLTAFVSCITDYKVLYRNGDKTTLNIDNFKTSTEALNMSDLATATTDEYYRDRKYVFIDKTAGTTTLVGQGLKVHEFGITGALSYDEEYVTYKDEAGTKGTLSTTGTALSSGSVLTKLGTMATYTIKAYTGVGNKAAEYTATDKVSSGIASFTSGATPSYVNVMSGTDTAIATVNYFYTYIRVFLTARTGTTVEYHKFSVIWDGAKFAAYRVKGTDNDTFAVVNLYTASSKIDIGTITTMDALLEKLVSVTEAEKAKASQTEYLFDVDYSIYDIAGNISSTVVRGVQYVKLSSSIKVVDTGAANAGVALLVNEGNNTYSLRVNEGASLTTLLKGLTVTNVDYKGENNIESIKYQILYNGIVHKSGDYSELGMNALLHEIDTLGAPGKYTIKLTSTRSGIETINGTFDNVEDDPLELNINIAPAMANISGDNYSSMMIRTIGMIVVAMCLFGLGYFAIKRARKND